VALKEAIEILSADCGWVALTDGEQLRVHSSCRIGIQDATAEEINRAILQPLFRGDRQDFVAHSLKQEYALGAPDAPCRLLASAFKLDGRSRGYLCLGRRESGGIFLSPDQKLISAVALMMAVELENLRLRRSEFEKQRLTDELELAQTIQQSLLPRDFSRIGFLEAAGASQPSSEIGGDFFDLIPIDEDLCTLVIADVSGKGPAAALQAAMVQGIVHAMSSTCIDLPSLMSKLNECLLARPASEFVTVFAATLNSDGLLRYSNGGHTSALKIGRNGEVLELSHGGPLLGVFPGARYAQMSVRLDPDDLIVLYTDGITETLDACGNPFGTIRLMEWACRQSGRSPREAERSLISTLEGFSGEYRYNDDCSVLVIRYTGGRQVRNPALQTTGEESGRRTPQARAGDSSLR